MVIRPAQPEDFEHIAALTNHYITRTAVHFATTPQTPEELRESWMASRERYPFLIAQREPAARAGSAGPGSGADHFLGFAKTYRWRERDAYANTAESGIYISLASQGQGVGKRLYGALIDACRAKGFHTLIGGIALPNDASIRLHEACGFTHTGTFRQVGRKFDAWHDVAFYQLMLKA